MTQSARATGVATEIPPSNTDEAPTHWQANLRGEDAELTGERPASWWTGPLPDAQCPGMSADGVLSSLPLPDCSRGERAALQRYLDNGWALTEVLFAGLQGEEAFYRPPYHELRHPMVFYYGHPAVLYVNKLVDAGLLERINPYFERIFETGVDEMSWDDMSKNVMRWPSVSEVREYRREVYQQVSRLIAEHPVFGEAITWDGPGWALVMGFEHERIHIETSAVLIRELPLRLVQRPAAWPRLHPSAPAESPSQPQRGRDYPQEAWVEQGAARVRLGKPRDWPSFGWDNEYGSQERQVRPFVAGRDQISNGAFLEFVRAGGYTTERFWSEEGWAWRTFRGVTHPTFWEDADEGGFVLRTQFERIPLPWSWAAEVNWHEARAYCAWRSEEDQPETPYRLLTEAEHHALRDAAWRDPDGGLKRDPVMQQSGEELRAAGRNLNLAHGSPSPVDAGPLSSAGCRDLLGNTWEWCEDHFHPFPGSEVHPFYDDFSTPCYDGKHQLMLGGAFLSTGDEASIWARFHFRPHFHQSTGFRLVRARDGDPAGDPVLLGDAGASAYETERMQREYLALHYAAPEDALPFPGPTDALNFPVRCASFLLEEAQRLGLAPGRALDIGCSVGRASFELAREAGEVLGLDYSMVFVETARALQRRGWFEYWLKETGELGAERRAEVPADLKRERVSFRQADACALPPELHDYDLVLLANVICRLPSPKACLGRMGGPRGLVKPGGLLLVTSPYTYMEEYTPKPAWLGGRLGPDGEALRPRDALQAALGEEFRLVAQRDLPLLIREHLRKYQFIVADATVWQRASD